MPEALNLPIMSVIPKNAFGGPLRWYHRLPWLFSKVSRFFFPLRVEGAHLLPATGPAVVIAPHMCYSDSLPFLYAGLPRPPRFIGSAFFVLANAPISWLMFLGGALPLDKHVPDLQAGRRILRLLAAGEVVALFPEGERSWAGIPIDPLVASAKFLSRLKVPVYLAQIEGSYDHWPRWDDSPHWRPITVRLRGPIPFPTGADSGHATPRSQHWWQAVYRRGGRNGTAAASQTVSSLLRDATRGEDARLNLFRRGRLRQVPRLLCFCPECGGPRVIAETDRLACRDCGVAWRAAPGGALQREGATEAHPPRLLSEIFVQMLATLRARIAQMLPLEEMVEVSIMGRTGIGPAHGRAVLDRAGLSITTAVQTWTADLACVADGQLEGSRVLEVHARDGTALSLHLESGALRLALAARALHGGSWGRYACATPLAAESPGASHA